MNISTDSNNNNANRIGKKNKIYGEKKPNLKIMAPINLKKYLLFVFFFYKFKKRILLHTVVIIISSS